MKILVALFILKLIIFTLDAYYVRPTQGPPSVACPTENDCYTLSEWVENSGSSFANGTTVKLLPGVHFVNTTKNRLPIENVNSLVITGIHGTVIVSCADHFSIDFESCRNITISHIVFEYCELVVSDVIQNIAFINVSVLNSGLSIYHYHPAESASTSSRFYHDHNRPCEIQGTVYILDSTFKNSFIRMGIPDNSVKGWLVANCAQLNISKVRIEDMNGNSASCCVLQIIDVFWVLISDVMVINNLPRLDGISVRSVYFAYLNKIKCLYNVSPMLILKNIEQVVFEGPISISNNRGPGIVLESVNQIEMNQNIDICDNDVQDDLILITSTRLDVKSATLTIENNVVTSKNGGILVLDGEGAKLVLSMSTLILKNNTSSLSDNRGAILLLLHTTVSFQFNSNVYFCYNTGHLSGGITLSSSKIIIENANVTFEHNVGGNGGAMAFYDESYITTTGSGLVESILNFNNNRALRKGGALFVEDSDYIDSLSSVPYKYFMREPPPLLRLKNSKQLKLNLSNNIAEFAGNDMYGGWIDSYFLSYWKSISFEFHYSDNDLTPVTSNPIRICICIDSIPICNITTYKAILFPGQTFRIESVAVGQRMGVVPSTVIAEFSDNEGSFHDEQTIQIVNRKCTPLSFTIYSGEKNKIVTLKPPAVGVPHIEHIDEWLPSNYHKLFQHFSINISLQNCRLGFHLDSSQKSCLCLSSIELHSGIGCDYSTFSILRTGRKWLSATYEHSTTTLHCDLIVHDQCPYDYCRTDSASLSFHLEFPDDQCAFNRSGFLCGQCQLGLSQVLGTSRCANCSSIMFLAVIPGSMIAGIVLICFLMFFNLTVSAGTINGLIFYANIIRASQSVFFPPEITASFLSIFIAWLNLDLGIETCFYSGLDAYAKTWLQFVFPLYIWLMVIIIITASHYSINVSKFTPNNALQVLATLFLLSYAKILQVVITVFSSTTLIYPDGFKKRVWLYDGNIEFLTEKHITLFIITLLLLLLLSVPFTFTLVSIQWLQKISHYRILFWVHRLMPLFDAYTGPYKYKHRYWTGLLLLVRVIFLTIFSLNQYNNPGINLLTIVIISFILLMYASYVHPYKHWIHNILEIMTLLNLGILSAATFYQLLNANRLTLMTMISVGYAFISFALILLFHAVQRLIFYKSYFTAKIAGILRQRKGEDQEKATEQKVPITKKSQGIITHTSIDLSELLIHTNGAQVAHKSNV